MSSELSLTSRPGLRPAPSLLFVFLSLLVACGAGSDGKEGSSASDSTGDGFVIQNPAGDRPYFFDFDRVPDGEIVTHVYELKNSDPRPITIQDIIPSCSCTNPQISYRDADGKLVKGKLREKPVISVPPGVVADLQIEINTKHVHRKNIDKLASVHLRCDSENKPFMAFELHLLVTKAFQATPEMIFMQNTPISTGARGSTDLITGLVGAPNRVLGIESVTEGMTATVEEIHTPGGLLWRVEAQVEPPLKIGPYIGRVTLKCTDEQGAEGGSPFHIDVRADVVPDVVVFPPAFIFDRDPETGALTADCVVTALAPGHRVMVADTLMQGDYPENLKLTVTPSAPDTDGRSSRWKLNLRLPPDAKPASFAGRVQVTLQDPALDVLTTAFAFRSSETN